MGYHSFTERSALPIEMGYHVLLFDEYPVLL